VIEVCAVYPDPGGELTAPAVQAVVPGRPIALKYRIRRMSRLHRRQRVVEITTERPTRLPALVVVRATGRYPPGDSVEGEAVAHIGPQPITPEQPVSVTVEPPKGPAWLACFIDSGSSDADGQGVLLFPPAAEEMRLR
jgi:hypothetical protein